MQSCVCVYIHVYIYTHTPTYIHICTYLQTIVELCSHVIKSSYIRVIPTDTQVKGKSD